LGKPVEYVWYAMMISTVVATTTGIIWMRHALNEIS